MPVFIDQCGFRIAVDNVPQRIISLVPSQTELLYDLGMEDRVVGITKYCVHPTHWKSSKRIVGGTKTFDFETIHTLRPDLIIGNKEENYQKGIEQLQAAYPVWISDIYTLKDSLAMISSLGVLLGKEDDATVLTQNIRLRFDRLKKKPSKTVLYLIWRKPWMAAASETFIHDMLQRIGLINCLAAGSRYPQINTETISALKPDYIFLSSEPFPFKEKHIAELNVISPSSKVILVDGEMFSWYGSRLLSAPEYFNALPLA